MRYACPLAVPGGASPAMKLRANEFLQVIPGPLGCNPIQRQIAIVSGAWPHNRGISLTSSCLDAHSVGRLTRSKEMDAR